MKSLAPAKLKRIRAVELASRGRSYEEIAYEVGYSHRGSAHRAVQKALEERTAEAIDELRAVEGARLDALQAALWLRAVEGDVKCILAVVRIIEQRCRLFGLCATAPHEPPAGLTRAPEGNPEEATA